MSNVLREFGIREWACVLIPDRSASSVQCNDVFIFKSEAGLLTPSLARQSRKWLSASQRERGEKIITRRVEHRSACLPACRAKLAGIYFRSLAPSACNRIYIQKGFFLFSLSLFVNHSQSSSSSSSSSFFRQRSKKYVNLKSKFESVFAPRAVILSTG